MSVKLKAEDLKRAKLKDRVVQVALDIRGSNFQSRFHQLPKHSILLSINKQPVLTDAEVKSFMSGDEMLDCEFKLNDNPPSLPDFILMEFENYASKGGPNILRFAEGKNIVPTPCRKVLREGNKKGQEFSRI